MECLRHSDWWNLSVLLIWNAYGILIRLVSGPDKSGLIERAAGTTDMECLWHSGWWGHSAY